MSEAYAEPRARVPHSANLAATLQRAAVYAEEQGHRLITLEHLLLALTEDPDAIAVLQVSGLNLDQVRNETASLVGRIDDRVPLDSQIPPQVSQGLARVMDAASSAAGSRRRSIDGGLVLAALIGEGSSPAAELLKMLGLTFDAALKTMRVPRTVSVAPQPAAAAPPPPQAVPRTRSYRVDPVPSTRRPPPPSPPRGPLPAAEVPRTQQRAVTRAQAPVAQPLHTQPAMPAAAPPPQPYQPPPYDDRYEDDFLGTPTPADYVDDLQPDAPPDPRQRPDDGYDDAAPARAKNEKPRKGKKGEKRQRGERQGERGPLILTLERKMKRGEPETIEARLSLRSLDSLMGAANVTPSRDAAFAARALTVRLRAPDEGAVVETIAPETQWIETNLSPHEDDFGAWRWTVVPQYKGKIGLRFSVASHTIGDDGILVEQALPDQVVDVRVSGTPFRILGRLLLWSVALGTTAGLSIAAEHMFGLLRRLLG